MIIEVEVEFEDDSDPKMRDKDYAVWGKMMVDLRKVVSISELIVEGRLIKGASQISLHGLGTWTINVPYDDLKTLWLESNPEFTFAVN